MKKSLLAVALALAGVLPVAAQPGKEQPHSDDYYRRAAPCITAAEDRSTKRWAETQVPAVGIHIQLTHGLIDPPPVCR